MRKPQTKLWTATACMSLAAVVLSACSSSTSPSKSNASGSQSLAVTSSSPPSSSPPSTSSIAADWPGGALTWLLPSSPGGGLDVSTRQLEPTLQKVLGVPLTVQYKPGGNFAIGTTLAVQQGGDCNTFMTNSIPDLQFSYLTQHVSYDASSLAPVGSFVAEPEEVIVKKGSKWSSLKDLISYAKSNPGKLRASVSSLNSLQNADLIQLEEQLGIKFNVVAFAGGGPAREAVLGGQVDFSIAGVFDVLSIADKISVLGTFTDMPVFPSVTDNAPTVNGALGVKITSMVASYGLFVAATCKQKYPERYNRLVQALSTAVTDPAYVKVLGVDQPELVYQTPSVFATTVDQETSVIKDLISKYPSKFSSS